MGAERCSFPADFDGECRTIPLGASEQQFLRIACEHGSGFSLCIHVQLVKSRSEIHLRKEQVQAGLDKLAMRHPILKTRIRRNSSTGQLELVEMAEQVQVEVVEKLRRNDRTWRDEVYEAEINSVNTPLDAPANRVYLVQDEQVVDFVVWLQHYLCDGPSAFILVHRLLEQSLLACPPIFATTKHPHIMSMQASLAESTPQIASSCSLTYHSLRWLAQNLRDLAFPPLYQPFRPADPKASPSDSRTLAVSKRLSMDVTSKLVQKCREERTTVTGIIAAVLLEAVAKYILPDKPNCTFLGSIVIDGRKIYGADPEDLTPHSGNFLLKTHRKNWQDVDVWDLAREYRDESLERTKDDMLNRMGMWYDGASMTFFPSFDFAFTYYLSSFGQKSHIQDQYGDDYRVVSGEMLQNNHHIPNPILSVYSIANSLHATLSGPTPRFSQTQFHRVMDHLEYKLCLVIGRLVSREDQPSTALVDS